MPKIKIDFFHIGFHKTASTYLQKVYFPSINNLEILNNLSPDIDKWFIENFVNIEDANFDRDFFLRNFEKKLEDYSNTKSNIIGISEENLSGNVYTGERSNELMLRIYNTFGKTKILIVIRNQLDYILSSYSNFIYHKGEKNFESWLKGNDLQKKMIAKLKYSRFIFEYRKIFGEKNVIVLTYENLFSSNGIKDFLSSYNLSGASVKDRKINIGSSIFGNHILLLLNKIGVPMISGRQQFRSVFPEFGDDRSRLRNLLGEACDELVQDNKTLSERLELNLPQEYFF